PPESITAGTAVVCPAMSKGAGSLAIDHELISVRRAFRQHGFIDALDRNAKFRVVKVPQMQALIGNILDRCITDAGWRGHNAAPDHKFQGLHERPEAPPHAAGQARIQTTSANSNDEPPSSPSSATLRNTTAWAEITLPMPAATPSTPCSPPPATTFAASSHG